MAQQVERRVAVTLFSLTDSLEKEIIVALLHILRSTNEK
jgi:hypothetical protein